MQSTSEDLIFGRAEEMIAHLDRQIAKAMEPPTWVLGASESERPEVRAQVQEWWNLQFRSTELLRETRNHLILSMAFSQALKDPRYPLTAQGHTTTPTPTTT